MTQVIFRGPGSRILAAGDLHKADAGVEGFSKTTFPQDEPVEVSDSAAKALISTPELFGKFEEASDDELLDNDELDEDDEAGMADSESKESVI